MNEETMKDCDSECSSSGTRGDKMCCITTCSFKNDKVLNETNFVDLDLMTKFLNEKVGQSEEWLKPIKDTMEICKTEGKIIDIFFV